MTPTRIPLVLALAVALAAQPGCSRSSSAQPQTQTQTPLGRLEHVGAEQFRTLAEQKGGIYLDVRTPGEVARGHLPNASFLDINDPGFRRKLELMPKDKPIFVYCASGARSGAAAQMMNGMGFGEVYDLSGGIGAWARAGYPVVRTETDAPDGADAMQPQALDALLQREKRVLVDYHTPWCAPCRRMSPVVDALAAEWKGRATVLRVDVDASEALAQREKIQGVPVFVLYVDGKERWRRSGELPRAVLEAELARP